uniref:Sfp1 n=1 Tax=Arundo donax TaxID=35708 RepID=A0A0A8YIY6_ARUDO
MQIRLRRMLPSMLESPTYQPSRLGRLPRSQLGQPLPI